MAKLGQSYLKNGRQTLFFSHPDFNRRYRNFTSSTAEVFIAGSNIKPASPRRVADFNRRLRFSLTPKNVYCFKTLLRVATV
jgi:hypothetical protein